MMIFAIILALLGVGMTAVALGDILPIGWRVAVGVLAACLLTLSLIMTTEAERYDER